MTSPDGEESDELVDWATQRRAASPRDFVERGMRERRFRVEEDGDERVPANGEAEGPPPDAP